MEFADRNNFEIQRMVDLILEIATNGLEWARERESERLDQERDFVEWGPEDKDDEGYLIEELAGPLPTHLSIIKTILMLQCEPVGSDEETLSALRDSFRLARSQINSFFTSLPRAVIFTRSDGWHATSQASPHFGITAPHGRIDRICRLQS